MKTIDLTGQTFDRLFVLSAYCPLPKRTPRQGYFRYLCLCSCGKLTDALPASLRQHKVRSCGCLSREAASKRWTKHGKRNNNKLYSCWKDARKRCNNPNCKAYARYGGRGIKMLFDDFVEYESHLLELYPDLYTLLNAGYQIDRIDNNGNYEKGNLRLVTSKKNNNNRRNNHRVKVFGLEKTISEFADDPISIVDYQTILGRLKYGWSSEEAICLPCIHTLHGSWSLKQLKLNKFPDDITLEEALAPVYLNNPGYGPLDS